MLEQYRMSVVRVLSLPIANNIALKLHVQFNTVSL